MKAVIVFNRMWAPAKRQIICIVVIVFVWVICLQRIKWSFSFFSQEFAISEVKAVYLVDPEQSQERQDIFMQLSWEKPTMLKIGFGHGWRLRIYHTWSPISIYSLPLNVFFLKLQKLLILTTSKRHCRNCKANGTKQRLFSNFCGKILVIEINFFSRPYFPYKRISSSHKALLGRSALCVENKKRLKKFSL